MKNVVFLGGGYTCLFAYKKFYSGQIRRQMARGELSVTVIADRTDHYFHGFTGEVLAGLVKAESILTPLAQLFPGARLVFGRVTTVAPFLQSLKFTHCESGTTEELHYDQLVVGCGTEDRKSTLPGLTEFALSTKVPFGLDKVMARLSHLTMGPEAARGLKVAVVGSGFTAVEMATNLAEYLQGQAKRRKANFPPAKVILFAKQSGLLREWQNKRSGLVRYAKNILAKAKIELRESEELLELRNGEMLCQNGLEPVDLVISAIGQQVVPLKGLRHLTVNEAQKIETQQNLLAIGTNNVWAGGDIALVSRPFADQFCPPNALWAIMQGGRIGKNFKRVFAGKKPQPFRFPGLGVAASFGIGRAACVVLGVPLTGWLAWLVRLGFFLYFFPALGRLFSLNWGAQKSSSQPANNLAPIAEGKGA